MSSQRALKNWVSSQVVDGPCYIEKTQTHAGAKGIRLAEPRDIVQGMLDHPALRHRGLNSEALRQRADLEAAAVLARAQAIAVERIAREEAALAAMHALQIEVNRALYMNEATLERSAGFDALADDLARFSADLMAMPDHCFDRYPLAAE